MPTSWETELTRFLAELLAVQEETLAHLKQKRELLRTSNVAGLAEANVEGDRLCRRLQECLDHRGELLEQAAKEGIAVDNITGLVDTLPSGPRRAVRLQARETNARAQLLKHYSLTNWVVTQRTLLHLSQILEIIATGGRRKPTYSKSQKQMSPVGGNLVDEAV